MNFTIWVGVFGTVVGLAFVANAFRNLAKSKEGHAANAARIHIPTVAIFLPVMWLTIWSMQS